MKFFLCSFAYEDQKKLLDYYLTYHNIDSNKWFFQKLFQSDNKPFLKGCIRYNQFLATRKEKPKHDFLRHYSDVKKIVFEEKPLDIIRYPALTNYQIEYKKYSNLSLFLIFKNALKNFCKR